MNSQFLHVQVFHITTKKGLFGYIKEAYVSLD